MGFNQSKVHCEIEKKTLKHQVFIKKNTCYESKNSTFGECESSTKISERMIFASPIKDPKLRPVLREIQNEEQSLFRFIRNH